MKKKEVIGCIIATILVLILFTYTGYLTGRMDRLNPRKPSSPTGVAITEYKPVVQKCPQVEECIYNDQYSYKLIKFTHKDGTLCYGIRPYGQGKFESMWCEKMLAEDVPKK